MGSLRKQREIQAQRRRHAHREVAHVTTKTGGLRLQAKECRGPPEVTRTHEAVKQQDPADALISSFQPPQLWEHPFL